jgi:mRNA interferase MazF
MDRPRPEPNRGEIWFVDLDPVRGHEQSGRRPALVMSANPFNLSAAGMVVLIPLSTKEKHVPLHVRVSPPEGGLREVRFIRCEDIRAVSMERLSRRLGRVAPATLVAVENRLRLLLEL